VEYVNAVKRVHVSKKKRAGGPGVASITFARDCLYRRVASPFQNLTQKK
jgi:hypothetical protein